MTAGGNESTQAAAVDGMMEPEVLAALRVMPQVGMKLPLWHLLFLPLLLPHPRGRVEYSEGVLL